MKKRLIQMFMILVIFVAGIVNISAQTEPTAGCLITGRVTNSWGTIGIVGITVYGCRSYGGYCFEPTQMQTETETDGYYSFWSKHPLPPYNNTFDCNSVEYIILPSSPGYWFYPDYQYVTTQGNGTIVSGIDFYRY